eukprot:9501340-Pyramimonas_sp.AAC.1
MRLRVGSAGRAPGEQRRDRGLRGRRWPWQYVCSSGPAATVGWTVATHGCGAQAYRVPSSPRCARCG